MEKATQYAKEVAEFFGEYHITEDGKHVFDNGDKEYIYNSPEELLIDLEDTLKESSEQGTDWLEELEFIAGLKAAQ